MAGHRGRQHPAGDRETQTRGAKAPGPPVINKSSAMSPIDQDGYNGRMRRVRIADLRNNLSRYLDHVRAGGVITILDRDLPVAQIVPLQKGQFGDANDEGRLD